MLPIMMSCPYADNVNEEDKSVLLNLKTMLLAVSLGKRRSCLPELSVS